MYRCTAMVFGLALLAFSPLQGQGRYVRLQGTISSSGADSGAHTFHLDAYKINAAGQRQLVRLSRFAGPDYHLYLETGYEHEVLIQMAAHPPHRVHIDAIAAAPAPGRLVLQRDFVVPVGRDTPAVAQARPVPPEVPEEVVTPMLIGIETADLLLDYGNLMPVAVQAPAWPKEEVAPLPIAFEETLTPAAWGHFIETRAPVPEIKRSPPTEEPLAPVVPLIIEDEVLTGVDYAPPAAPSPVRIEAPLSSHEMVATIEMTTAAEAPEHPGVFQKVVNAALPPAPRRARLLMRTSIVAGLDREQRAQSVVRLPKGQEVQIIEYTTPDWWMVSYGSLIGWVESRFFEQALRD